MAPPAFVGKPGSLLQRPARLRTYSVTLPVHISLRLSPPFRAVSESRLQWLTIHRQIVTGRQVRMGERVVAKGTTKPSGRGVGSSGARVAVPDPAAREEFRRWFALKPPSWAVVIA